MTMTFRRLRRFSEPTEEAPIGASSVAEEVVVVVIEEVEVVVIRNSDLR